MGNIPALKAALAEPYSHAKVKAAFNSYDLTRSGYLTRPQFGTFACNLLTLLETGPNGPSVRASLGIKTPTDFADAMFADADKDGDNRISFQEFEDFVASQELVIC